MLGMDCHEMLTKVISARILLFTQWTLHDLRLHVDGTNMPCEIIAGGRSGENFWAVRIFAMFDLGGVRV
jgi:hypothetical protein